MPRAIPFPIRLDIIERHLAGQSLAAIAQELQLSYRTVRTFWRRYCDSGNAALQPNYARCGPTTRAFPHNLQHAARTLKTDHPRWGAGLIQLQLRKLFPSQTLPSWRTLQRWWQQDGLQPERRRAPPVARGRGQQPHEVWELDAKERIRLQDGSWSSVVSVVDEASGALLSARPFPPALLVAVAPHERAGLLAPGL
jgi:transposase